jgi:hypothetical protein
VHGDVARAFEARADPVVFDPHHRDGDVVGDRDGVAFPSSMTSMAGRPLHEAEDADQVGFDPLAEARVGRLAAAGAVQGLDLVGPDPAGDVGGRRRPGRGAGVRRRAGPAR